MLTRLPRSGFCVPNPNPVQTVRGMLAQDTARKNGKKANAEPPKNWYEIVLDGEDEVRFPRCRWRIHHLSMHVLMTRLRRERCLFSELNNVFDPLDTKTHLVIAMTATTSAARFVLCRKSRVSRCVTPRSMPRRLCSRYVWSRSLNGSRALAISTVTLISVSVCWDSFVYLDIVAHPMIAGSESNWAYRWCG